MKGKHSQRKKIYEDGLNEMCSVQIFNVYKG